MHLALWQFCLAIRSWQEKPTYLNKICQRTFLYRGICFRKNCGLAFSHTLFPYKRRFFFCPFYLKLLENLFLFILGVFLSLPRGDGGYHFYSCWCVCICLFIFCHASLLWSFSGYHTCQSKRARWDIYTLSQNIYHLNLGWTNQNCPMIPGGNVYHKPHLFLMCIACMAHMKKGCGINCVTVPPSSSLAETPRLSRTRSIF